MVRIIAIASLGVSLALANLLWNNAHSQPDAIAANLVSLSIGDIALKVDAKSLPEQRIEDRTVVFVGP